MERFEVSAKLQGALAPVFLTSPSRLSAGGALRSIRYTSTRIMLHPANKGRRTRAFALYIGWQLWERLVRRPWTIRLGRVRHLRLYPHSTVAALVLYYRIPDFEEMSFIQDYLRSGDLFVDVGANIGVYSLWASETEGVDIVAFEPSTTTSVRAVENVELNKLADRIQIVRRAVGAVSGKVQLTTDLGPCNRVSGDPGTASELVQQTTLDAELGTRVPSVIKIDVEGGEMDVLRGGWESITRHHPPLLVEVNDPLGLTKVLDELGYQTWSYDPKAKTLAPTTPVLQTNVLALADVDATRARLGSATQVASEHGGHRIAVPQGLKIAMSSSGLRRGRRVLRQRGAGAAAQGVAREVWARFEVRRQRRRGLQTFVVDGVEHTQLVHLHNRTWRNERAVEVPLALAFLDGHQGPVLELGNVLGYYGRRGHTVVDKYEEEAGVLNVDVVDYRPAERFGAIVAVSTLEHVGWDEEPRDPEKIPRAVQHLRSLLLPGGRLLVTCPIAQNPHLDALIADGELGVHRQAFLVRGRESWSQVAPGTAFAQAQLNRYGGTALWVAEFLPCA